MKALMLATDGFEDSELTYPYWRLEEAEHDVHVATPDGDDIEGKNGQEWNADASIDEHDPEEWADEYDVLVVPGGRSPESLRIEAPDAADIVGAFDDARLPIAAICHGAQLLISADVLEGRELTAYPSLEVDVENAGGQFLDEEAVTDENLVTSRDPDDLPAFMRGLFELVEHAETVPA